MTTDKQRAANRRNAQKSTGPRTAAGKERSSRNATKHGCCTDQHLIAGEDPADFETLRDGFFLTWDPRDPVEEALVRQMVTAEWRLRRLARLETAAIDDNLVRELDRQESCPEHCRVPAESNEELEEVLLSRIHGWDTLDRYARYSSANARQFNQAMKNLMALRKQRDQQQQKAQEVLGNTKTSRTNPFRAEGQQDQPDTPPSKKPPAHSPHPPPSAKPQKEAR